MSPALSDLPIRKITRAIELLGFVHVRTKGSHAVYRHVDAQRINDRVDRQAPVRDPGQGGCRPFKIVIWEE